MAGEILYLRLEKDVEMQQDDVFVKDLGKLTCANPQVLAKAKAVKVFRFQENGPKRRVVGVLKVVELLSAACPGVSIESVGEMDTLVERVDVKQKKGSMEWVKILFVTAISFFGTAFTIMAFHNDIGINQVFEKITRMVTGKGTDGFTILELMYSVGLSLGIILFFNHIGGRRITKDPTPIEVEMRVYEREVNDALIETSDREGKSLDVQ